MPSFCLRRTRYFIAAFTFWSPVTAAIVSVEGVHLADPVDGFSGRVEAAASRTTGNTDKADFSLGARLQWHQPTRTAILLASGSHGETLGQTNTEKAFLHGRQIRQQSERFAWEAFAQAEHDQFARLAFRGLIGGGARATLYRLVNHGAGFAGIGAFFSQERIEEGYPDAGDESLWRANAYLVLNYRSGHTALTSATYYQPAFEQTSDYRILQQARLEVEMSESLSLVLSIDLAHDSRPPVGVDKTDVTYQTSFAVRF